MNKDIKLTVPIDFELPRILKRTSPEENAAILSAGPSIHKALTEMNYTQRIDELSNKLSSSNHESRELKKAVFEMEERFISAIEEKLSDIDTDVLSSISKIETRADPELTRDINALNDHTEKLTEQLEKLSVNNFVQSMEQFMQRMESSIPMNDKSSPFETLSKSSVMIGQDNEKLMEKLLIDTFATQGSRFELIDKHHFSGDHIFRWNDMTIMVEDKKYKGTVPFKETGKALRDFKFHPECDVLIMISMDTPIRGHETANGIDSIIFDSRLVLFVSNFMDKGDPKTYIQRVIQPIIMAGKTIITKLKQDPEKISEKYQFAFSMLPMVISTISDQENILIRHIRDTTETVNAVHRTLNVQRSNLMQLFEILQGNDDAIHGNESTTSLTPTFLNEDDATMTGLINETVPTSTSISRPTRVCKNCGGNGHDSRNCPEKAKSDSVTKLKLRTCKTCGGTGHDSRNCPHKK